MLLDELLDKLLLEDFVDELLVQGGGGERSNMVSPEKLTLARLGDIELPCVCMHTFCM